MLRIGSMNKTLHEVDGPEILYKDSLSEGWTAFVSHPHHHSMPFFY